MRKMGRFSMSHFWGSVRGSAKNRAARKATVEDGLHTEACSWDGKLSVELYRRRGKDWFIVRLNNEVKMHGNLENGFPPKWEVKV